MATLLVLRPWWCLWVVGLHAASHQAGAGFCCMQIGANQAENALCPHGVFDETSYFADMAAGNRKLLQHGGDKDDEQDGIAGMWNQAVDDGNRAGNDYNATMRMHPPPQPVPWAELPEGLPPCRMLLDLQCLETTAQSLRRASTLLCLGLRQLGPVMGDRERTCSVTCCHRFWDSTC